MRAFLVLLAVFGLAGAASAQSSSAFSSSDGRVTQEAAKISFPRQIGGLTLSETKEFSRPGESLDTVIQYKSADEKVFGTVYLYYPGLSHSGLAAIATDEAIRHGSGPTPPTSVGSRIVAAAGLPGVAIRNDYGRYKGSLSSSAAFIKAGRWMVKLRVSGPQEREAEVRAAMAVLLDQVRFEGKARPSAAVTLATPPCASPSGADAQLLPDDSREITTQAMFGVIDPVADPTSPIPPRVGTQWCRTSVSVGDSMVPIIRATDPDEGGSGFGAKSRLFALYSDAGGALEIVSDHGKYVLLNHMIGATSVHGTFDAVPSNGQIAEILAGKSDAGRERARVNFKANGNTDINVPTPPPAPSSPTT